MIEHPYGNEEETCQIDQLTIENRVDRVQVYGSVELTKDKAGLGHARQLKQLVDRIVEVLSSEDLPEHLTVEEPTTVKNPFG
jgi:hypothetical protein